MTTHRAYLVSTHLLRIALCLLLLSIASCETPTEVKIDLQINDDYRVLVRDLTVLEADTVDFVVGVAVPPGVEVEKVVFARDDRPHEEMTEASAGSPEHRFYYFSWPVTHNENGVSVWTASVHYTDIDGRAKIKTSDPVLVTVTIPAIRSRRIPTGGIEAACGALGAACVCSEPLNVVQELPRQTFIDPIDSEDLGCDGEVGNGSSFYTAGGGTVVEADAMPMDDTTWVWRVEYNGGGIANLTGNALTLERGTVCTRIYQRFSDDYPLMGLSGDPSNERNKLLEMSGSGWVFQTQFWPPNTSAAFSGHATLPGVYDANFPEGPDQIGIADCKERWCRMEQCIDRNGTTATFRVRATVVGGRKVSTGSSGAVPGVPVLEINRVWIGNLFRQGVTHPGERFISHGMQAYWPTADTNRWIGPACEVEGC